MKVNAISNLFHGLKIKAIKNSSQTSGILTGVGMACTIGASIFSAYATVNSIEDIKELKKHEKNPTSKQIVKTVWKNYIPTGCIVITGLLCNGTAQSINMSSNIALGAAYEVARDVLRDYKETTREEVGEKKERIISEKTSQKRIDKSPINEELIIQTGTGNYLCKDEYYERWFRSSQQSISNVVLYLNEQLQDQSMDEVTLNDLYTELGVNNMKVADYLGWSGLAGDRIDISFDSCIATTGEPCLLVRHNAKPLYRSDHELSSPDVTWVTE